MNSDKEYPISDDPNDIDNLLARDALTFGGGTFETYACASYELAAVAQNLLYAPDRDDEPRWNAHHANAILELCDVTVQVQILLAKLRKEAPDMKIDLRTIDDLFQTGAERLIQRTDELLRGTQRPPSLSE